MMLRKTSYCFFLWLLFPMLVSAGSLPSLAVVVVRSPTLTVQEKTALLNIVSNGFQLTKQYSIVDPETLNNMLEDEVNEALLLGNEAKLDEIQKKYKVNVLVSLSAKLESMVAIGGYSMASASVTITCRSNDTALIFEQQASEPQNGFYGMPEWLGATSEAARKVALQAAVAGITADTGMETVQFPIPERLKLQLEKTVLPRGKVEYLPKFKMTADLEHKLTQLVEATIGERERITCSLLDSGKRLGAAGITKIDIDIQRGRRLDTARFEIFDVRKQRLIRRMELPRSIKGIRRPKSRDIVGIAFAPTGRFLAIVSKHPVLWLYDNLSGDLLCQVKLSVRPASVSISQDGTIIKVTTTGKDIFFSIVKK